MYVYATLSAHTRSLFVFLWPANKTLFFCSRARAGTESERDAWRMMKYVSFTTPEQQSWARLEGHQSNPRRLCININTHRAAAVTPTSEAAVGEANYRYLLPSERVSDGQSWANAPPLLLHLPNFRIVDERKAASRWSARLQLRAINCCQLVLNPHFRLLAWLMRRARRRPLSLAGLLLGVGLQIIATLHDWKG